MNSGKKLQKLIDTFFTHSVDLSETATIKVINDYIRESKNGGHVNDWPIQLTIVGGRCTDMRLGTGHSDENLIQIWHNEYSTESEIKDQVNHRFEANATANYNVYCE